MSLVTGALSQISDGVNGCVLNVAAPTGGTGPYTYQWYESTTSGFTPGAGNLVAGATSGGSTNQSFSGLQPNTTYYFVAITTDTSNSTTVTSSQLAVTTEQPLVAGALTQISGDVNACVLNAASPTGGVGPYTFQWYMSTVNGFTPGSSNIVSGATAGGSANQSFSGLMPSTVYYFVCIATDSSNNTAASAQLTVTTLPSLTAAELVKFSDALGSQAAAAEMLECIIARRLPSVRTQTAFAVAMTDNLWNKWGTASWEIFRAILSGRTLSVKTQKKFAYVIGDVQLALKILNLIQTSATAEIIL